jgi:hypothetical protein
LAGTRNSEVDRATKHALGVGIRMDVN